MRKRVVGVMGNGEDATDQQVQDARELGRLVAKQGWMVLTGGRSAGVMDAAPQGAKEAGGLTVGILPTSKKETVSAHVDIAIFTDLSGARNNLNVLSSDVVAVCGMCSGTASEVALGLRAGKQVVLVRPDAESVAFFQKIGGPQVHIAADPKEALSKIKALLG